MPTQSCSLLVSVAIVAAVVVIVVGIFFVRTVDEQLLCPRGALVLCFTAFGEEGYQLVVTGALGVVDVLVARLGALQCMVENANQAVNAVFGVGKVRLGSGPCRALGAFSVLRFRCVAV